jgi:hypothetical protein
LIEKEMELSNRELLRRQLVARKQCRRPMQERIGGIHS